MLEVHHISKSYPGEELGAVKDVSFHVEQGEIVSIIGKSGSGKTTLLRMLAGLMKPDSGELIFQGEPFKNPEEQLIAGHDSIKMVFQDYELMPSMTVKENVAYKLLGLEESEKTAQTNLILELCGIIDFIDRLPRELSGGQQQRLSLARALAEDPELLLMDEPFSSIDPISKQVLLLEIQRISKELNVGLVFVTHDTLDAMMISDRIGFMQEGRLIQIDTPETLYKAPDNIHLAKFLGLINEFDAQELKVFEGLNIPEGQTRLIVRAEDLKLRERGKIAVSVIDCRLLGPNYLVRTKSEKGRVFVHYTDKALRIGEQLGAEFDYSKAIYLR